MWGRLSIRTETLSGAAVWFCLTTQYPCPFDAVSGKHCLQFVLAETGEANTVFSRGGRVSDSQSAGGAQTSTEKATSTRIHLSGFATLGVVSSETDVPFQDSGSLPSASSLHSPHQLTQIGGSLF